MNQAVSYQYQSMWDMLKSRYLNTEHFAKAVNLEAFYLGYMNADCSHMVRMLLLLLHKEAHPHKPPLGERWRSGYEDV